MRPSLCLLLVTACSLVSCTSTEPREMLTAAPSLPAAGAAFPVSASLRTDTSRVAPGGAFNAIIDVRIAVGWHISAADRPAGEAVPTRIRLELPPGIEPAGEGSSPDPTPTASATGEPHFIYDGNTTHTFRRPLRVNSATEPRPKVIRCVIEYQACNRFECKPPAQLTLETTVHASP